MPDERPSGRRISPKAVLWLIVAVFAVILVVQNTDDARVDLFFWHVTTGIWVVIVISLALGIALGWLLAKLGDSND